MPSIISGYEYDIFISYRQKDNKGEHWVTEFVNALKTELEATFKEDVSIYFDENPHDGLLETHDVDESLKKKLKCPIFIPILSQTYCDPKSFAWKNEFLAFKKLASEDQLGLKVSLRNGNVASRILPVKIHDLDADDKFLLESEVGPLRSVDLIFKSPGVNRALRHNEDHPNDNLNKTFYRDQINKVANAVKDIITAIKNPTKEDTVPAQKLEPGLSKPSQVRKYVVAAIILLAIIGYFGYQKINSDRPNSLSDKSIAVLPFDNLSDDKGQEYFSEGMMDEILNQLVKVRDLKVISRTSSMSFKNSDQTLKDIASQLGVANVVEGTVMKAGDRVRISVKLIKASSDQQLWSETYNRDLSDIFTIQSEISKNIARELKAIISLEEQKELEQIPTSSQLAYDYYLKALQIFPYTDFEKVIEFCSKAIEADPNFAMAYLLRCESYASVYFNRLSGWENSFELAKVDFDKAKALNVASIELKITEGRLLHFSRRYKEAIDLYEKLKADYPNYADIYSMLASSQRRLGRWSEARMNHEKAISLDPADMSNYREIARFCLVTRDYSKAYEYAVKLGDESFKEACLFVLTGNPKVFKTPANLRDKYRLNRQLDDLIALIDSSKSDVIENAFSYMPKALDFADAYYLKGDRERAKQYANEAIAMLEKKLKESSNDERLFWALSVAYAHAGRINDAISYAKKTVQMVPLQTDAFVIGPFFEDNLFYVYIICGQYDLAMDKLEWLLTIPGSFSNSDLKVSPWFDPLRDLPRFQKILNTEYQTKL